MNNSIKELAAKIPFAKRVYRAIRRRSDASCGKAAEASEENNPLILRQGSPECFDGLPLKVSWNITKNCNYRCSYCFDASKGYKKEFCSLEQAETAINHIASANRPCYDVVLIGGEPTTHPHLPEIISQLCDELGERLRELTVITNGSFDEKQIDAILKASERTMLKLIVSIHLEFARLGKIVDLVKQLSNKTCLILHLMFHPEMMEKFSTMAETLCSLRQNYPFLMTIVRLREPPSFSNIDSRYTQEMLDYAQKARERFNKVKDPKWNDTTGQGYEFWVERMCGGKIEQYEHISLPKLERLTGNVFTDLTCVAGANMLSIGIDGSASGMVCSLDAKTCNIFDESPFCREEWIHGIKCTKPRCGCEINYRIPKFRSPEEAEQFIAEKRREQKRLMVEYKKNE